MALFNYAKREINAKIVYYGPGLCGKTTNIKYIHEKLRPETRGKLLSLATETDRTLFFDFLPVDLGEVKGYQTRFQLYTVPGQVFYNSTRKMVLKGADGIVFVADSQREMLQANQESLANLRENLAEQGKNIDDIPMVIQYNKRDLFNAMPVEELDRFLSIGGHHRFVFEPGQLGGQDLADGGVVIDDEYLLRACGRWLCHGVKAQIEDFPAEPTTATASSSGRSPEEGSSDMVEA